MSEMLSREEPLKDMKGFQAMMFVSKGGVRHLVKVELCITITFMVCLIL